VAKNCNNNATQDFNKLKISKVHTNHTTKMKNNLAKIPGIYQTFIENKQRLKQ